MNITKVSSENTQKHKYISVNQALAETLFLNPEYSTKSPQKITLADLNDNLIGHEYISPSFTLTKKLCDQINEISGDNNSHFEEGVVPGIVQDLLITNKSCIHKALTIEGYTPVFATKTIKYKKMLKQGDKIKFNFRIQNIKKTFITWNIEVKREEESVGNQEILVKYEPITKTE